MHTWAHSDNIYVLKNAKLTKKTAQILSTRQSSNTGCHFPCSSASDDSLSTNQRSAVSLVLPFRYRTTVLDTSTEGSQKSLMVWLVIFGPFTTSENGNGNNCVLY